MTELKTRMELDEILLALAHTLRDASADLTEHEYGPPTAADRTDSQNKEYGMDVLEIQHQIDALLAGEIYPMLGRMQVDKRVKEDG